MTVLTQTGWPRGAAGEVVEPDGAVGAVGVAGVAGAGRLRVIRSGDVSRDAGGASRGERGVGGLSMRAGRHRRPRLTVRAMRGARALVETARRVRGAAVGLRHRALGVPVSGDAGMATAEYAIVTVAAAAFAGLLIAILRSDEVRGLLLGIVRGALSV